ncbi:MAG TPA: hypothetical protein EYP21_10135 [Syntrophaceae bacterium]|nr:hypothetical protein [Syntrophaceae bacterium]
MPVVTKLSPTRLTAIIERGESKYIAICPELDLATQGDTPEEAFEDLIDMTVDYAEEYAEEFELYHRSPNRTAHWEFLKQIQDCCGNRERIRDMFL